MIHNVAFIGLGIMGSRMALNLVRKGFAVTVYNRTPGRDAELLAAGAKAAATPRACVADAEAVLLMLTGPQAVEAVLDGPDGVLAGLRPGACLANMSTVTPAFNRSLEARVRAAKGLLVDAPVSGSKKPAEDGALLVLAGGPAQALDALEPVFLGLGRKVVRCGDLGQGSAMKLSVNLLLGVMAAGLAESLNLGNRLGLSLETQLDVILSGPLGCQLFQLKAPLFRDNAYPAQFPLAHMAKDLRFVLETAAAAGAQVPNAGTALGLYAAAEEQGLGGEDFAVIRKVLDQA